MLVFEEEGKTEGPGEKSPWSKDENQQQTQPIYDAGSRNRTWPHWREVGGRLYLVMKSPSSSSAF